MTVTYASDSFNRGSDGDAIGTADVGGAWTSHEGNWLTNNSFNYAYSGSPTNDTHNHATLAIAQNDVDVSVSVFTGGVANRINAGIYLRDNGTDSFLALTLEKNAGADRLLLQQIVGFSLASFNESTSFGILNSTGYTVRAVFSGSNVSAYVDGVLKLGPIAVNAALTTQRYGIGIYASSTGDSGSVFQSFLVTDTDPGFTGFTRPQQSVYRM